MIRALNSAAVAIAAIFCFSVAQPAQIFDAADQTTASCLSKSEIAKDASRLSALLQSGDPLFVSEFPSLYGPTGPKACATRQLVTQMAKLDPSDVTVTGDNYTIDPWRIVCTNVIAALKNHQSISDVNQEVAKQVLASDHDRFMAEFNSRAKAQQLHIRLAENSSTHQLEFQTDSF